MKKFGKENPSYKHGMSYSSTFRSWAGMITRCTNPKVKAFAYYGGRGISICLRWYSFSNFLSDMGHRPKGMSLERIDNDGNYCPENCKWATRKEQNNNSRHNRKITILGVCHILEDWSRISGIEQSTLSHRMKLGWAPEHLLLPPGAKRFKLTRDETIRAIEAYLG